MSINSLKVTMMKTINLRFNLIQGKSTRNLEVNYKKKILYKRSGNKIVYLSFVCFFFFFCLFFYYS